MALLHCPECGHDVSDRAAACPNCGYRPTSGTADNRKPLIGIYLLIRGFIWWLLFNGIAAALFGAGFGVADGPDTDILVLAFFLLAAVFAIAGLVALGVMLRDATKIFTQQTQNSRAGR